MLGQSTGEGPSVGDVAIIEVAAASGLGLVPPAQRDPMRTTTFGTGQLILAALEAGCGEVIVALGGSATVDGGCGCAQALGVHFTDAEGEDCVCGLAGGGLGEIVGIDLRGRDPRVMAARIRAACDVTNPLLGPQGAAAVYAPQKGATPEMVETLEAGLANLAERIRASLGRDVAELPGAGAAGGFGAGLAAFTDAMLERAPRWWPRRSTCRAVFGRPTFASRARGHWTPPADSARRRWRSARLAGEVGVPVICIAGVVGEAAPVELFADVRSLVSEGVTGREAIRRAPELLKQRTVEAMRGFLSR